MLPTKKKAARAVDMFCGAGGFSTAFLLAAAALGIAVELTAINHWDVAISSHQANHPHVRHLCEKVDNVAPLDLFPDGIDYLLASPECTHHSRARGGKPMSDQSRATPWHVLRWVHDLRPKVILIENVGEFQEWGILGDDGRPVQSKKGLLYKRFLLNLRDLGYRVDTRELCAANYGDATTRKRLFIVAWRVGKWAWPDETHQAPGTFAFTETAADWVPARNIIDWTLPCRSIYARKKALVPATMTRIFGGLRKICKLRIIGDPASPYMTGAGESGDLRPFLVVFQNNRDALSLDKPLPTILTSGAHFGFAQPIVIPVTHAGGPYRSHSIERPLPTITGAHRGELALVEPFLVGAGGPTGSGRTAAITDPLGTVMTQNHRALVEPSVVIDDFLLQYHGSHAGKADGDNRVQSLDIPLGTIDTSNRYAAVQPFLMSYYGNGTALSIEDPLDTVTARDRFALVSPEFVHLVDKSDIIGWLDIGFRMLQPHELAAAMSFPMDYKFEGNREDHVKQIGNAVPVKVAQALCIAALKTGGAA